MKSSIPTGSPSSPPNSAGRDSAKLGLLLETAQEFIGTDVFGWVIAECHPWDPSEPLFDVDQTSAAMARLAEKSASPHPAGGACGCRHWEN